MAKEAASGSSRPYTSCQKMRQSWRRSRGRSQVPIGRMTWSRCCSAPRRGGAAANAVAEVVSAVAVAAAVSEMMRRSLTRER